MTAVVTATVTLGGAGLIGLALRDIFHELFHPTGSGSLSRVVMRVVWRAYRRAARRRPALLALAGPVAFLAVISTWTTSLAVGWALVLWPQLPEDFLFATGLDPHSQNRFVTAFYLSLVTLATLGYGDITPTSGWLRLLGPLEALIGFGLLTAAISWVLSTYPVLARRRALAHELTLLGKAERATATTAALDLEAFERLLASLTARLVTVHGDLTQFPVTYYFHTRDERYLLPATIRRLVRLAGDGGEPGQPQAVRLRAAMLRCALDDFAATLGRDFLDRAGAAPDDILRAYAADHLVAEGVP